MLDIPDDLFSSGGEAGPAQIAVYLNAGRPMEGKMAISILNQFADRAMLSAMNVPPLFTIKKRRSMPAISATSTFSCRA